MHVFLITWRTDDEQVQLGGDYGSALCAACANGHEAVVKILLGSQEVKIVKNRGQ